MRAMRSALRRSGRGSGADLERHRHVDRGDHRLQDAATSGSFSSSAEPATTLQTFFAGQPMLMSMICGAAVDVEARRLGQHLRVGAGDLHRDRARLAGVVEAQARLARLAQLGAGGHHLGDRERRAEAPGQAPERAVGDAGHRSDEQAVAKRVCADLHGRDCDAKGDEFYPLSVRKKTDRCELLLFYGNAEGPKIMRRAKKRRGAGKISSAVNAARGQGVGAQERRASRSVTRIVAPASRRRCAAKRRSTARRRRLAPRA